MARRRRGHKRPYGQPHPELDVEALTRGFERTQVRRGATWKVRRVSSQEKEYTCPGCHRAIPRGVTHVVAYREDHLFGAEAGLSERRHWHLHCWNSA